MAAGLNIERKNLQAFQSFVWDHMRKDVAAYTPTYTVSDHVHLNEVSLYLVEDLGALEPFGQGNATPKFVVGPVHIVYAQSFGDAHMRMTVEDCHGTQLKIVHFKAQSAAYAEQLVCSSQSFFMLGTFKKDTWRGRESVGFYVDDLMDVTS